MWILAVLILLFTATLFAYREAPNNGFHFDDQQNIVDHRPLHMESLSIEGLATAWSKPFLSTRPLASVTFALDWWRGAGQPAPFQWTNITLHSLNALLVFGLILVALRAAGHQGSGAIAAALAAAALWALHPIQVQAVTYAVQRMTLLAGGFMALSVLAYVRGRLASRGNALWFGLALVSAALGAASKEIAWMLPLLWWLAEFGVCRSGGRLLRTRLDAVIFSVPFIATALVVADVASGSGPVASRFLGSYEQRDFTLEERLLTQPRVVLFHLSQVFWPLPDRFSVEHDFPLSRGLTNPPATLAAIVAILAWCLAGLACLWSRRARLAGFFMLWVPVTLAVESSFVSLEMVFEHRMYVPSIGIAGLIALGIASLRARLGVIAAMVLAGAVAVTLSGVTMKRVPVWKDDLSLYSDAVAHAPNSPRVLTGYGNALLRAGRTAEAEQALSRATELDPEDWGALERLGVLMMDRGDYTAADRYLRRALELRGGYHSILNHLGEVYMRVGNLELATDQFANAVAAAPNESAYRWNLAVALEQSGKCAPAREQWQEYLRLETSPADRALVEQHLREEHGPGGCSGARSGGKAE